MKNKAFLFGISLTSMAIAAPLICSVPHVYSLSHQNDATVDFFFGPTNKNKYTIGFNDQTKTCYMTRLEINEDTDSFVVPATCPRSGEGKEQYALDQLLCKGSPKTNKNLKVLDLSQAKNLVYIGESCFESGTCGKIHWVNFAGANSLKQIEKNAFKDQFFDNSIVGSNLTMDFSDTKLETISDSAFSSCCTNDHNTFSKIIFPKTLSSLQANAFHWINKSQQNRKFRVEKIVFTRDTDIPTNLFGNNQCLPCVPDSIAGRITVPYNAEGTYRELNNSVQNANWNHIVKESYVQSILTFKDGFKGSNKIVAQKGLVGIDATPWIPYDEKSSKAAAEYTLSISNSYNGIIEIDDKTKKIKWRSIPEAGTYVFTVTASYKDTLANITHYCNSGIIALCVLDPKLTGGSTYLYGYEGKDNKSWKVDFVGGDESIRSLVKNDIKYTITKPMDFDGVIELQTSGQKGSTSCNVKWQCNDITLHKIFPCQLSAKIEFDNITIECSTTIYITTVGYYNINIKDSGQDISEVTLIKGESKTIQVILQTKEKIDDVTPQFSFNTLGITVAKDSSSTDLEQIYNVTFQTGDNYIKAGKYEGYFYFPIKYVYEQIEYSIPATSNYFQLIVQNDAEQILTDTNINLSGGNQVLSTYKNFSGADTSNWQISGDMVNQGWSCTNIMYVSTPWFVESGAERLSHLQTKEVSQNTYKLGWDATYCTNVDIVDIFDFNMQLTMQKDDKILYLYRPITTMSMNSCDFVKNDTLIEAIPNKAGFHSLPWTIVFNNDQTLVDKDIKFSLNLEDSGLTDNQIYLEPLKDKANSAMLKWNDNIPKGYYLFSIVVSSEKYYTYVESNPILLSVEDSIEIIDVPKLIECEAETSGSLSTPVSTYVNGVKTNEVSYSLLTVSNEITIDPTTGIISWQSPKLPSTNSIVIEAIVKQGEDEEYAYSTFTFKVNPKSENNSKIGAMIGIGCGSAVAGAGIATGTTLFVKKKIEKKKCNKK